ncbi:MAG: ABC transporter permease [Spirochaetales bacterium]|nr:ABC transporter permease [Spirochaetales bacterium]
MKRLLYIVKKELGEAKGSLPFHIIAVASPLVFLCFWVLALAEEISLPVTLAHGERDPAFASYLETYATPDGIRYFDVSDESHKDKNVISIERPITVENGKLTGTIVHEMKSMDRNMTKNFRNRLTGAVTSYIEKNYLENRAVTITEKPVHRHDILWKRYFAASLLVMGILMGGLLFGSLGVSKEWQGTMILLSVSPVSPWWVLAGKEIAVVLKGLVSTGCYVLAAAITVPGLTIDIAGIAAAVFTGYLIAGLAGMLAGIAFRDAIICFLVSLLGSLGLWLLGNGFGTMAVIGPAGACITRANPATYLLAVIQHVINGTPVQWQVAVTVLFAWYVILQGTVFLVYRRLIYMPGGRPQ